MPFKARTALEERQQFIDEWQNQQDGFAELCRRFGISRPTGYKWVERYEAQGEVGLADQSRAPHQYPQALSDGGRQASHRTAAAASPMGAAKTASLSGAT